MSVLIGTIEYNKNPDRDTSDFNSFIPYFYINTAPL